MNIESVAVNSTQLISESPYSQLDPLGLTPIPQDTRQRFLRFRLSGEDNTLLPLIDVVEILQLTTADILPIPDVPSWLLGVCNWRGNMLWLTDVSRLMGGPSLWRQTPTLEYPTAVVVQSDSHSLGLVVEHVDDVELISPETIFLEDTGSPILAPFIVGHLPDRGGTVLDVARLLKHSFRTLS
ncbi:MAG: chemotaxis protein CheW [Leptolyngbyaceae cyanobacterium]